MTQVKCSSAPESFAESRLRALSATLPAFAQAQRSNSEKLVELWGSESSFGPLIQGEFTIDGRALPWRPVISGFDVPVQRNGDAITFVVPGNQGEFQGRLCSDLSTIFGHWIQDGGH